MADCEDTGLLEGGVLKDSTFLRGSINTSTIEASTFTGGAIEALTSIDNTSAKRILDALIALGPDQLAALGQVLLTSAAAVATTTAPASSTSGTLPTTMYGSRDGSLGTPVAWGNIGGYAVPLYTKGGA